MDIKEFRSAVAQIAAERGIPEDKIMETIEKAIAAAYKKDYGKKGQVIEAKFDPQTGQVKFWRAQLVVDEDMILSDEELEELKKRQQRSETEELSKEEKEKTKKVRFSPEKHIMLAEAQKKDPDIKPGEELRTPLDAPHEYGRIATQTAKQVILQKVKEVERATIWQEYRDKEGEMISGVIQRVEHGNVYLDIGKIMGVIPPKEQIPNEFYKPGQRLRVYVLMVEKRPKGPVVFLSRAYPKLVSKLFELEVPEISAGQVEIKSVAREAGFRSKIAVQSKEEGIDPIGAAVGRRGTRVGAVMNELGGEKMDIIEYSEDPAEYIANSLSPAKVLQVKIQPRNKALALVPEDQLSLAIGKKGQNVRLAANLTGWKIDVRSAQGAQEEKTKEEQKEAKQQEKKPEKQK